MKLKLREVALALVLLLAVLGAIMASSSPANVALGVTTCGISGCVSTPPLSSSTSFQYTATSTTSITTTSTTYSSFISSSTTTTSVTTTSTFFSYTSTISTTISTTSFSSIITGTQTSTNTNVVTVPTTTTSSTTYTSIVTQRGINVCPVALVTTGNSLEPYANFLRGFRNNQIQNTTAGRQFMLTFNNWYYSWAPTLSYTAANNPWVFRAVQAGVYPLLGILYASYYSYNILAPLNAEVGAVTAGIVAASLIGVVYVAPLAYVATRLTKRRLRISKLTVGPSAAWFTGSALLIAAAYATSSGELLALSTSSMVLSMLSLGSLIGARAFAYVQMPVANFAQMALEFRRFAKKPF